MGITNIIIVVILILVLIWGLRNIFFKTNIIYDKNDITITDLEYEEYIKIHNENYGEGLLFNSENNLIEAISANIFIKNANGEWLTPDLSYAGINGVMRSLLIEKLFPDCGIAVKLAHIDFESLRTCQELFICNSIRGIIPINSIYNSIGDLVDTKAIGQQIFTLQTQLRKNYPHYK